MTAAQPNNIGPLADAAVGDAAAETAERSAEQQPEYVGDMPDDPDRARTYRPGDDQSDGSGS
jgi:hypothetical protein